MRYLITIIIICISTISFSQQNATDSSLLKTSIIEFNGTNYNGYSIELNASPDIVENTVKEKFKLLGLKPKETKGFMVYRNVIIQTIEPNKPIDAFVKVERKSRKEKEQSTLSFIAAPLNEIPEEKVKNGSAKLLSNTSFLKSDTFIYSLLADVKLAVYNSAINDQLDEIKKEEKKLANLKSDLSDMEKKLNKLQSDIDFNKKTQQRQIAEIEKSRNSLNQLMTKNPSAPIK